MLFLKPNIEKMEARKNTDGLVKALRYKDIFIRNWAASALGRLGDPRLVESLIIDLKDFNVAVRRYAALNLRYWGDKRAAEPLVGALNDSDDVVRKHAAFALGRLLDKRAVEPLILLLKHGDDLDYGDHFWAAGYLGDLGDPRAVEPLIAALESPDHSVRECVVDALMKLDATRAKDILFKREQEKTSQMQKQDSLENEFIELLQEQTFEMIAQGYNISEIPKLATSKAADIIMDKHGITMPEMVEIIESATKKDR